MPPPCAPVPCCVCECLCCVSPASRTPKIRACGADGVVLHLTRRHGRCVLCGRASITLTLCQQTDELIVSQAHLLFQLTPHEKFAHCLWSETIIDDPETQNSKSPTSSDKFCIRMQVVHSTSAKKIPLCPQVKWIFGNRTQPPENCKGAWGFFLKKLLSTSY